MRQCLTSELGGYYTRAPTAGEDQFGTKGDFVTSPEISQVFGELIGIWLYAEWLAQGRKEKVQIIEVGPGRGTLMDDVLRTLSSFKRMTKSIEAIYLVEASPHLQKQQALRLAGTEELEKSEVGWKAKCKYFPDVNIQWCEDIRFVPKGASTFLPNCCCCEC
jgi:SAM-dependent MidA family methyltransferase